MRATFLNLFPTQAYSNIYGVIVLASLLSDEIIPRLTDGKSISFGAIHDHGLLLLIQVTSLIGFCAGIYFCYHNIGIVPFSIQLFALILVIASTVIREWAIVMLRDTFHGQYQYRKTSY